MGIRSKFMSIVTAFTAALFPSDGTPNCPSITSIASQQEVDNSTESSSSDYGSTKEDEEDSKSIHSIKSELSIKSENTHIKSVASNKSILSNKSLNNKINPSNKSNRVNDAKKSVNSTNTFGSLEPMFKNSKLESDNDNSSGTNDFTSQLETTDFAESFKNLRGRHKAMSPLLPYRATQKVFKDYVSPNPFFNFLRDFRFNKRIGNPNERIRRSACSDAKKAGREWRKMSPDEKVYYRAQAEAAKERLKMVASKILKRYPSRKFLAKKEPRRGYSKRSLKSMSYIS